MTDPTVNSVPLKEAVAKRVYQTPKLLSYGSFQTVTLGGGGVAKNDGASRFTKP